jgi:branched-chain amino acid transport system substrate-binding protein
MKNRHATNPMESPANPSRRQFFKSAAAATVLAAAAPSVLIKSTHAAVRPIKIGFVTPKSGVLAAFSEADEFILSSVRKLTANGISVNGVTHPIQIVVKDSRSDPNRAAEVAASLIKADKIDLMVSACHAETINSVSDQAELNGVPCITTDCPWQVYFFPRGGKPDRGFDWTYHFFWGLEDSIAVYMNMWNGVPTNKVVGALWPNDASGNTFSNPDQGFPRVMQKAGFKLVDPGRFELGTTDFSAEIRIFKQAKVLTGILSSASFTTFWSQAAQQGFRPKVATIAAAILFPTSVEALGDRGLNLSTEVNWAPGFPYKSGLTGQSAMQLCAQWEQATGREWTQPIGHKHALFEVAIDVLKRTKNINSPASIRDAILTTNYNSIVGHIQWTGRPVKNVAKTPLVGGQWVRGRRFKYDLAVVSNETAKDIPIQVAMRPL